LANRLLETPEAPREERIYIVDTSRRSHVTSTAVHAKEAAVRARVKKWGNSAAAPIPASVLAAAALNVDEAVEVREEGGRIVIEPFRAPVYDLDRLLDQMRPETFPDEVDFGPPVGVEAW